MKRLYLHNSPITFTGNEELLQLLQSVFAATVTSLEMGPVISASVPDYKPSNRTKDYYTEQHITNAATGNTIAVLRDGKLQTLNKLSHPFQADMPIEVNLDSKDLIPTRALRGKKRK